MYNNVILLHPTLYYATASRGTVKYSSNSSNRGLLKFGTFLWNESTTPSALPLGVHDSVHRAGSAQYVRGEGYRAGCDILLSAQIRHSTQHREHHQHSNESGHCKNIADFMMAVIQIPVTHHRLTMAFLCSQIGHGILYKNSCYKLKFSTTPWDVTNMWATYTYDGRYRGLCLGFPANEPSVP